MKTHFLSMGIDYWLVIRDKKTIIEEVDLESCLAKQKEIFLFNMYARG